MTNEELKKLLEEFNNVWYNYRIGDHVDWCDYASKIPVLIIMLLKEREEKEKWLRLLNDYVKRLCSL